ncbi:MAG TPA: UDP-N-acetylmuramoyl-L-alanyl-D-glutamate--2,6-diaminopimelate ligase [Epulopiscium sp.]|nr:UDP-N-acetylmuramoyl-L-alanyl-D-glutamate--2,6-diaminopimelate ligase [Candidatus Epulonipiscium sp.]
MILKQILNNISYEITQGTCDLPIDTISYDSRSKMKNGLFVCIEGYTVDGHQYVSSAIENGASAIIVQKEINVEIPESITIIKVEDTRTTMAIVGANFYGHPSKDMALVGITGTNGKTTTAYLIGWILESMAKKIGIIGTIENRIGKQVIKSERTTPESLDLQRLLRTMKTEEVSHTIMEVSSHALALERVNGVRYKIGMFTNLSLDHLDFHKTVENYLEAKTKLFTMCDIGIVNIDDPHAKAMTDIKGYKLYTFGIDKEADFKGENILITADGVQFDLVSKDGCYPIFMPIPGKFSVYNALGAIAASCLLGISIEDVITALGTVPGVPGRFQSIPTTKEFSVIVDYAHTPDGLENVLKTVQEFALSKIITVFGCGGDRDKTKRPIMAEIAGRYSDYTILTSDNPRSEDPDAILNDIEVGIKNSGQEYEKLVDREMAIKKAIQMAQKDDVIVIAGKGHEDYQILKDRIIHFDDVEMAKKYLQEA